MEQYCWPNWLILLRKHWKAQWISVAYLPGRIHLSCSSGSVPHLVVGIYLWPIEFLVFTIGTSRGLLSEDFVSSFLWWAGPSFLKLREQYWPQESHVGSVDTDLEARKIELFVAQTKEPTVGETLIGRFSPLRKIQRIVAYCRRAVQKEKCSSLSLTAAELFKSLLYLISEVEKTIFAQELSGLQKREPCSKRLLVCRLLWTRREF